MSMTPEQKALNDAILHAAKLLPENYTSAAGVFSRDDWITEMDNDMPGMPFEGALIIKKLMFETASQNNWLPEGLCHIPAWSWFMSYVDAVLDLLKTYVREDVPNDEIPQMIRDVQNLKKYINEYREAGTTAGDMY